MDDSSIPAANSNSSTPPDLHLNALAKPFTPSTKPKQSGFKSLGKAKVKARRPYTNPNMQKENSTTEIASDSGSMATTDGQKSASVVGSQTRTHNQIRGQNRDRPVRNSQSNAQSEVTVRTFSRDGNKGNIRMTSRASDRDENWRSRPNEEHRPFSGTPRYNSDNGPNHNSSDFATQTSARVVRQVGSNSENHAERDNPTPQSRRLNHKTGYQHQRPKSSGYKANKGSPRESRNFPSGPPGNQPDENENPDSSNRSTPARQRKPNYRNQTQPNSRYKQHKPNPSNSQSNTSGAVGVRVERQISDEGLSSVASGSRSTGQLSKSQQRVTQPGGFRGLVVNRSISVLSVEDSDERSQREKLEKQLQKGTHACLVCMANIKPDHSIWSCLQCYNVFHLRCIQNWARSKEDIWCCPTCQAVNNSVPQTYLCYCGKQTNPEYNRNEIAHSCGEMCGKARPHGCTHPCNELCHPGRCSPCGQYKYSHCLCSKSCQRVQCGVADLVRCTQVCNKTLTCTKHQCEEVCHTPPCKTCEETGEESCYCGAENRTVLCTDRPDSFSCDKICDKLMDCGNHTCKSVCHIGPCECTLTPDNRVHCHCGKTEIGYLVKEGKADERKTCLDKIPTCDKECGKILPCGPAGSRHKCRLPCHEGSCVCELSTDVKCRCANKTVNMKCEQLEEYTDSPYECKKKCKIMKSCGRHRCNQNCCVLEDHTCFQICNKKLSCKLHQCQELCHHGKCPTCPNTSFDELSCHCGLEVIYPPIHCGTSPPECHRPCTRKHPCDHQVPHPCHSNDTCPPCTVLVDRWCMGKHELRSSIMCFMKEVSCGKQCYKLLSCGQHRCKQTCHKDSCPTKCTQPCTRARSTCGHDCGAECHPDTACPPTPCKAKITLYCKCGRKSEQTVCSEFNKTKGGAVQMFLENQIEAPAETRHQQDYKCLPCDDECSREIRNKQLAEALDIINEDLFHELSSSASTGYNEILITATKKDGEFIAMVEKVFIDLIEQLNTGTQKTRRYPFPAMKRDRRQIIHELGEVYQISTESFDEEPKRNVVAMAERGRSRLPSQTLTSYVKNKQSSGSSRAPVPVPVHLNDVQQLREHTLKTQKEELKSVGKVDYFDFTG